VTDGPAYDAAAAAARDGYGRLVGLLAAGSGDLQAAEDALGDALERALRTWPADGVPDNPAGWLLTVARRRLRDRHRSVEVRRTTPLVPERHAPARLEDVDPDAGGDRRLELMLACAHPAVDPVARTPLMLTTVLGFTAAQVAPAFSVPAATMATRLTRAKRRIRDAGVPFTLPDRSALPGGLTGATQVGERHRAGVRVRIPVPLLRIREIHHRIHRHEPADRRVVIPRPDRRQPVVSAGLSKNP